MLGEILAVLLHAFSSHPIPSSQVKSADCSDWRTVSGQSEGKRLVTSVLGFSFEMLPGGWWAGRDWGWIGLHSACQQRFKSWLGRLRDIKHGISETVLIRHWTKKALAGVGGGGGVGSV